MGTSSVWGMSIERVRSWYWSLGKFDSLVVLLIITVSSLLLFRLPEITYFKGIYFNETLQDSLIAIVGLICVLVVKPPTISYFGWPRLKWLGGFAFALAAIWCVYEISGGYDIKQPLRVKIAGVITLLSIGLAEEMISRVLIFGTLLRFGTRFAVLVSSLLFGLMHINVYLPDWSAWDAYWHVMSASGFGIFVCALFIATRSYWVVVIFHALADWTVVFDKLNTYGGEDYSPGILEGLSWGVEDFFSPLCWMGLMILFFLRGKWPNWAIRLAIKWKLVEQAEEFTPSKSRWSRNRLFRRT